MRLSCPPTPINYLAVDVVDLRQNANVDECPDELLDIILLFRPLGDASDGLREFWILDHLKDNLNV